MPMIIMIASGAPINPANSVIQRCAIQKDSTAQADAIASVSTNLTCTVT